MLAAMRTFVAAAAVAALVSASACTMTQSGRSALIGSGAAATMVGATLVAIGPTEVDSDGDGANEWALNDDYTVPFVGTLVLVAGLSMFSGGLSAKVVEEAPVVITPIAPAPIAPSVAAPVLDDQTLLLVDQIRQLVANGHCEPARPLVARLYVRSPAFHRALVAGPVLEPCPALR